MKIRTQLILTMLLFGFTLALVATLLIVSNQQVDRINRQKESAQEIESLAGELSYLSNDYLLNREIQQRARWYAQFDRLSKQVANLQLDRPDQQVLVSHLETNLGRLQNVFTEIAGTMESTSPAGRTVVDLAFIQVSWSRLEVQNQNILFDASLITQKLHDQADQLRLANLFLIFILIVIFGFSIFANYFLIYRRTLRALKNLQTGTRIIGSGNLNYAIQDNHADEFGELSQAFNQMTTSLREITASKADLERVMAERQQAEAALRQSEAQMHRLVEANLIGVITRDQEGRVKDANDAFLTLAGYTRQDVRSGELNLAELIPAEAQTDAGPVEGQGIGDGAGNLDEEHRSGLLPQSDETRWPRERVFLRKDGRRVPVLVGETQLEEEPADYIGFVLDLSDLKKAQAALGEYAEKLERSNQDLEQFAFIASHDLKEPLRKIRGFSDRLARKLGDTLEGESREYLARMQNAAERMQAMIDDLLELSRVSRRDEAFETVCLSDIVAEVLSDLDSRAQAAQAWVQVGALPELEADPLQMRQLLQNLIGNAIKYHRPDAPPVVKVWGAVEAPSEARPMVTLWVEDNGIGFSEEYLEYIFQPFTRLHGRGDYEGTGMGLAICKKIVDRHQGTITAHSRPGEGATFVITLPVRQRG